MRAYHQQHHHQVQQCAPIIIIISMKEHFRVELQPVPGARDDGVIRVEDFRGWKHHNPSYRGSRPYILPGLVEEGWPEQKKVCVIIMIREIRTWVAALSEGSYEIFPQPARRRRRGDRSWLLEGPIEVQHPFERKQVYPNIQQMYKQYLYGYLTGGISMDDEDYRFAIVKYENLLPTPEKVVTNLQTLGLRRNSKEFEPQFRPQGI